MQVHSIKPTLNPTPMTLISLAYQAKQRMCLTGFYSVPVICQLLNHGVMKQELGTRRTFILINLVHTYLLGAYSVPDRGEVPTWKC